VGSVTFTIVSSRTSCVLLAAPHHGLTEGIRSLLGTAFDTVVMVADEGSMCETAQQLRPSVAVVDLVLAGGDLRRLIRRLRLACVSMKVILISVHHERAVANAAKEAGADGLVVKGRIATDLLPGMAAVLRGETCFPANTE
jgi:DNA-binding NarL/FixJ family response regulator